MKKNNYQIQKENKEIVFYIEFKDVSDETLMDILKHSSDSIAKSVAETFLTTRGGANVYQLAIDFCKEDSYKKRAIGANILGQITNISIHEVNTAFDLLNELAMNDKSASVRSSAICSMAHRCNQNKNFAVWLLNLCFQMINDKSVFVRQGIAFALSQVKADSAIVLLITLCKDAHDTVKNWAAFAVNCNEYDAEELRNCFVSMLSSKDPEVKREAIIGLGRWKDPRVIPMLVYELSQETVYDDFIEAAGNIGDKLFLPILASLLEIYSDDDGVIQNAMDKIMQN